MATRDDEITVWLERWSNNDPEALSHLMPLVYEELRQTARGLLSKERPHHTLQPTALVHEAYARLDRRRQVSFEDRKRFFAFASQVMHRVLIDYAKKRGAEKRRGNAPHDPIETIIDLAEERGVLDRETLLYLDTALQRFKVEDPELAQLVELRYFAGLTVEETAEVLGMSRSTFRRRWKLVKLWFAREFGANGPV